MSVDTRLYISPDWTVQDIKEVIEMRFKVKVKIDFHDWGPDYIVFHFNDRQLSVHLNSTLGGLKTTQLSLGSNIEGIEILRTLAKTFGGLFQEHDYSGNFEEYVRPGDGNMLFVTKLALRDEPALGDDDAGMADYILKEKWRNKEVWHKNAIAFRGKKNE